jgi:hypothetical protein
MGWLTFAFAKREFFTTSIKNFRSWRVEWRTVGQKADRRPRVNQVGGVGAAILKVDERHPGRWWRCVGDRRGC